MEFKRFVFLALASVVTIFLSYGSVSAADAEPSLDTLLIEVKSTDYHTRQAAAKALGEMPEHAAEVVPALVARLGDRQQPYVFAQALGKYGVLSLPAVIEVVKDQSAPRMQRLYAVMAIGEIGPPAKSAVPLLIETLKDIELQHMGAEALGKLGTAAVDAVPALIELKDNSNYSYIKRRASEALVLIGTPEALSATRFFRVKTIVLNAIYSSIAVFLYVPGSALLVPLVLFGLYHITKRRWAGHPLVLRAQLVPLLLWGLYAVYETSLQLFQSGSNPIRVDLLFIAPLLFAALLIGLLPWLFSELHRWLLLSRTSGG